MKILALAAMLAASTAFSAQAESFNFSGTATLGAMVSVTGPDGKPVTTAFNTGKGQTVMAGKSLATDSSCAANTALPGGVFEQLGQCTFTDPTGGASILFGCNANKAPGESDCWGELWGTSGAYSGRHGAMTWHNKANADGKTAAYNGVGQWTN